MNRFLVCYAGCNLTSMLYTIAGKELNFVNFVTWGGMSLGMGFLFLAIYDKCRGK